MSQLRHVTTRIAVRLGLNLNWLFDPAQAWRLREPLRRSRINPR